MYKEATIIEINEVMGGAWSAFKIYRNVSLYTRAELMRMIARGLNDEKDLLIATAAKETNLPEDRLQTELQRTIFQLNDYAAFCESGLWLDVRIDLKDTNTTPARVDIRKTHIPLGPVVVFGAANFPFAYSTAGGDTACALAAGCPVIVKGHPGHAETSKLVAAVVSKAVAGSGLPSGVFSHIYGASSAVGEALVKHERTKAVGFTGSFKGGKQLFDWGNQRTTPIPVFAEMSSVNPVFILPERLAGEPESLADLLAASITLGSGQFCTNPGLMVAVESPHLQKFINLLSQKIAVTVPALMLNEGIYRNFISAKQIALEEKSVITLAVSAKPAEELEGMPTIASVSAADFLQHSTLKNEVFGPYSLLIRCADINEMLKVAEYMDGQLTSAMMATHNDLGDNPDLIDAVRNICGRFILNAVPTGVQVGLAMQHGGPFPSTTDSRFTSVGADGIKRFARPVSYQNWPEHLLPPELKDANPLGIWRTINNELKK